MIKQNAHCMQQNGLREGSCKKKTELDLINAAESKVS